MAQPKEAQPLVQPAAVAFRRRTIADREGVLGRILLAPAFLYVILVVGVPFVLAILLSFSAARSGSLSFSWVGLSHFSTIIADPQFQLTLRNTLVFTIASQVLVMILATAAANVLDAAFFGKRAVRMLILLPWAVPVSLAAMSWAWIFDSTFSVINWTLRASGLFQGWLYWLGDTELAMIAIIIVHVWRTFPFATVVVLAGMTAIPLEIREAAVIDGASFWRRLFQVNLPLLLPVVTVAVLFGVVFTSTDLSVVYLLTRGGPYNSTHVLASLAFQRGILGGDLGQGAAIALFLLPALVVVAIVMLRLARRAEVGA
ncbi:MAG: carbohydrate ABC transporter permease [bacterium]|jgi:multiple sugar transport system permease protein